MGFGVMKKTCANLGIGVFLTLFLAGCELPKEWFGKGAPKNGTPAEESIDLSRFDGEVESGSRVIEIPGLFEVRLYHPHAEVPDPKNSVQNFPDAPPANINDLIKLDLRGGSSLSEIRGITLDGHRLLISSARFMLEYKYVKGTGPDMPTFKDYTVSTKPLEIEGHDVRILLESKSTEPIPVPLFDALGVEVASDRSGALVRVPDRERMRKWLIAQVPKLVNAQFMDRYFHPPRFENVPKLAGTSAIEKGMAKWIESQKERLLEMARQSLVSELGRDAVIDVYRRQLTMRLGPLPLYGNHRVRGTVSKGPNESWVFRPNGSKGASPGLESAIATPTGTELNQGKLLVDDVALGALMGHALSAFGRNPEDKTIAYVPGATERGTLASYFKSMDVGANLNATTQIEVVTREHGGNPGPRLRPWKRSADNFLDLEVTFLLKNADAPAYRVDLVFTFTVSSEGALALVATEPGQFSRDRGTGSRPATLTAPLGGALASIVIKAMVNRELRNLPALSSLVELEILGSKGPRADGAYGEAVSVHFRAN